MKISFWISAIVFYYVVRAVLSNCIQVGTVLFTNTDLVKKCWSESDKALLRARFIMQDVLPDPDCIDFSKPDAILTLLDYFQSCYSIIGTSSYGKLQNLMCLALSDAIGGYLRSYALPLTRRAYYAGQVKYSEAKKLFRLYDDIKIFLKTNGMGWAQPQKLCRTKIRAKPLVIGSTEGGYPCKQLYTIEKKKDPLSGGGISDAKLVKDNLNFDSKQSDSEVVEDSETSDNHISHQVDVNESNLNTSKSSANKSERLPESDGTVSGNDIANGKKGKNIQKTYNATCRFRKCSPWNEADAERTSCDLDSCDFDFSEERRDKSVVIPLPVLEDCGTLHTIAIPFKVRPLRNVQSRKAAFVLEHYYIMAVKCIASRSASPKDVKHFNGQFHSWLVSQVLPHLDDEQWYPAFGGVYRIMATIKKLGSEFPKRRAGSSDIGYIFSKGFEFRDAEFHKRDAKDKVRDVGEAFGEDVYKPQRYYLYAVIILTIVWVCAFCACVSYCWAVRWVSWCRPVPSQSSRMTDDEKLLNFQFLINFFKKNKGDEEKGSWSFDSNEKFKIKKSSKQMKLETDLDEDEYKKNREENKTLNERNDILTNKSEIEKKIAMISGGGDIPKHIVASLETQHHFTPMRWPYHTSFMQFDKMRASKENITEGLIKSELKDKKKLETLWKKSSSRFFRITENKSKRTKEKAAFGASGKRRRKCVKTKTSEYESKEEENDTERSIRKKCSSCGYSETCSNSCITSTNSSSQTQVGEEMSSETRTLFEHSPKHNRAAKHSEEESTEGSETEIEGSYSSEIESTETTLN